MSLQQDQPSVVNPQEFDLVLSWTSMNESKDQGMSSVAVDLQHGEGDSCTRQKNRLGLRLLTLRDRRHV